MYIPHLSPTGPGHAGQVFPAEGPERAHVEATGVGTAGARCPQLQD